MKNDQDRKKKLARKKYEKELYKLQVELCKLQAWVVKKGLKVIIVFEDEMAQAKVVLSRL